MLFMRNTLLHLRIGLCSAICLAMLLLSCTASSMHAADEAEKIAPVVLGGNLQADVEATPLTPDFTVVVVKGGGLWPQIQTAPDGTLLALGYNAAAHTTLPGDVDAWASTDSGRTWNLQATAAARPAKTANYCHWASGLSAKGDVLVVASGMDDAANEEGRRAPNDVRVFRSEDFGKTWTNTGTFPARVGSELKPYPFGSIVHGADGSLRTVVYSVDEKHANAEAAWLMASRDEGRSWQTSGKIADGINETVLLPLAGRGWLCVARTSNRPAPEHGQELRQFRSSDDGKSWGAPLRLFQASGDMGYPSTVQLSDDRLVTVFYAHRSVMHDGYHMGAVGWQAPQESNGTGR